MGKKSLHLKSLSLLGLTVTLTAQDPWAVEVVSYHPGTAASALYQDPETALGRPTVDTYTDFSQPSPDVVAVPVYAPWDFTELVSIGEGGSLVLRMGKPIINDPAHPYGIDLLVFTYTFITGTGVYDQYIQDPEHFTLADSENIGLYAEAKAGEISLSEDGITWFSFSAEADLPRLLPTLGRVWTGSGWGEPTDPTFPPDPGITLTDLAGMNLAELCRRYRGGAGGTGFDLENLLPPEEGPLPGVFNYVKISVSDDGDSLTNLRIEIDAVTVVSPVEAYTRWTQEKFEWLDDPEIESPASNPDSDPFSNWQEFARGGDPRNEETALWLPQVEILNGKLSYSLPKDTVEAPWFVQSSASLNAPLTWQDLTPQPAAVDIPYGETVDRSYSLSEFPDDGVMYFRLKLKDPL